MGIRPSVQADLLHTTTRRSSPSSNHALKGRGDLAGVALLQEIACGVVLEQFAAVVRQAPRNPGAIEEI